MSGARRDPTAAANSAVTLMKQAVEAAIAKGGCLGDMNEAQTQEFLKAQLEGQQRSVGELEKKTSVNEASATTARERQREWLAAVSAFSAGGSSLVPVLPIGDSMLEPFWCAARAARRCGARRTHWNWKLPLSIDIRRCVSGKRNAIVLMSCFPYWWRTGWGRRGTCGQRA